MLDLVGQYKGAGRNVTTDNFFTSRQLSETLKSWNLTLVGTVRLNKRFLPSTMQPEKSRIVFSTNFVFRQDAMLCSYVPKKKKAVILLLSTHSTVCVEATATANLEIITFYNRTKVGVDPMDKMLMTYTVKQKTSRWSLALFYNMLDVAALGPFIIYKKNNPTLKGSDVRRIFLKALAKQLCTMNIDTRINSSRIIAQFSTRSAFEHVLGYPIKYANQPTLMQQPPRDETGRLKVTLQSNLRVLIGNHTSTPRTQQQDGIPQVFVLSVIIFLLIINGIGNCVIVCDLLERVSSLNQQ